ncbi:flagellar biosynthesis protein FlhA [Kyrpidia spormannii]|uniref:Flagellar biosynthesis protein FlhA n=1 Tax=Kyrpidia spormannii TaxID=2055160 RepID=A0A2K8N8S2_9BACL|nr:flagellar biosynthesis protein FlhA [Kyrpidia spormannii]ATY85010.1 flagellar biosynthesis protein FlhA [Kyrpidia spormannii]
MKRTDLAVLVGVIGIVVMMVIPLPPSLLDFLLVINLGVSLVVLLIAMNVREPLQFSVFPALLLLTTLYRLALNVSSTRSILSVGYAGEVIQTFGDFVVRGNVVVGLIVFAILAVIQFVVITRGAERVAEVAARFTLDAMPGKQISIDADLSSGLITEQEARERRRTVEREADFYGAMDGASKFVKGDAIASIIIVVINIIGGFIIGMAVNHQDFNTALSHYTLLSVGDGLVSQIPALLISTATGLVVTRAASDNNMGRDVITQLLSYPKMLFVVASALALLGILTPIGWVKTWPVAGVVAFGGWRMQSRLRADAAAQQAQEAKRETEEIRTPESVVSMVPVDPVEFEFGYGLIPLADAAQGGDLLDRVVMIRRQLALELGVVLPVVRIRDNIQLQPDEYVIKIRGSEVARGRLMLGYYLAISPGVDDPRVVGVATKEPAFGLPALWIGPEMRERAELSGYTVVDPPSVVATHLTEVLKRHAYELIGRQETRQLIDALRRHHAALVDEVVPNVVGYGEVQKVLSNLLREGVPIRDLATIVETLADAVKTTHDPELLTEFARQALRRTITQRWAAPGKPLTAITLHPGLERQIAESIHRGDFGAYVVLDPRVHQQMVGQLVDQVRRAMAAGQHPVIVTSPHIRSHVRRLLERTLPDVAVLSYQEIDPAVDVETAGVVNVS